MSTDHGTVVHPGHEDAPQRARPKRESQKTRVPCVTFAAVARAVGGALAGDGQVPKSGRHAGYVARASDPGRHAGRIDRRGGYGRARKQGPDDSGTAADTRGT
jgi:hypothetical protein